MTGFHDKVSIIYTSNEEYQTTIKMKTIFISLNVSNFVDKLTLHPHEEAKTTKLYKLVGEWKTCKNILNMIDYHGNNVGINKNFLCV